MGIQTLLGGFSPAAIAACHVVSFRSLIRISTERLIPMRLFDTHAHLDFPALYDQLDTVLQNAKEAGVEYMVSIGASRGLETNHRVVTLVENHDNLFCTVGIHPHDADLVSDDDLLNLFHTYRNHPKVVAIGETGLDYHYDRSDRNRQQEVFRASIRFANEVQKPVTIHARNADDDTLQILREESCTNGILHCFTGGAPMAKTLIEEFDFYISFSGIATYKNAADVLEIATWVPPNRILVETDAPYLAPVPKRGKTNEPAFVAHTALKIAQARNIDPEEFADTTFANAFAAYRIPLPVL